MTTNKSNRLNLQWQRMNEIWKSWRRKRQNKRKITFFSRSKSLKFHRLQAREEDERNFSRFVSRFQLFFFSLEFPFGASSSLMSWTSPTAAENRYCRCKQCDWNEQQHIRFELRRLSVSVSFRFVFLFDENSMTLNSLFPRRNGMTTTNRRKKTTKSIMFIEFKSQTSHKNTFGFSWTMKWRVKSRERRAKWIYLIRSTPMDRI